jgi:hypothetical protein
MGCVVVNEMFVDGWWDCMCGTGRRVVLLVVFVMHSI